jgi:hypothetical protein
MPIFIECTSLSVSYDIMGIATVTYTVVSDVPGFNVFNEIQDVGGQTFRGYVVNASVTQIPNTDWYETHATLIATTN